MSRFPTALPYIVFVAAAAAMLFLLSPPPVPAASKCSEAKLIRKAWATAKQISGVPDAPGAPPESIRIVYEPRHYFRLGGTMRLCGQTEWYLAPAGDLEGYVIEPDVQVYVLPGDCDMLYSTLVHEFLHVIHAYLNGGPGGDDEAWVKEHWPAECR